MRSLWEFLRATCTQSHSEVPGRPSNGLLDNPNGLISFDYGLRLGGRAGTPLETLRELEAVTAEEVATVAQGLRLDTVYFLGPDGAETEDA